MLTGDAINFVTIVITSVNAYTAQLLKSVTNRDINIREAVGHNNNL